MNWLDLQIRPQTKALLSCIGLGFAALMLGFRIGMPGFEAIAFAALVAASVEGLVEYVANPEGEATQLGSCDPREIGSDRFE